MVALWRPGKGIYIKELNTNWDLFQFYHELDVKRVLECSPWFFNKKVLILSKLQSTSNPCTVTLDKLDLSVQIHNLPTGMMTSRVVEAIGGYVGIFKELCSKNFMGTWREYMCICVTIGLNIPMKRRMWIRCGNDDWVWANFKYENAPIFCFICEWIGHSEKFCPMRFDVPKSEIV